jgi:hypothetical protein
MLPKTEDTRAKKEKHEEILIFVHSEQHTYAQSHNGYL